MRKVFKRFGRAAVSVVIAGTLVYFQKDPKYLILVPVLQAFGKWLRDKLGVKYVPV